MRAVVLARGLARRMQQEDAAAELDAAQADAAAAGHKAMMPVGGDDTRPFLDYVLTSLADAGARDVALVIGPEHDRIRHRYLREQPASRLQLSCVEQAEARGTADAVLACRAWAGDGLFVVVNADNLYPVDVLRTLLTLPGPGLPVFSRRDLVETSRVPPERLAAFALVRVTPDGDLASIVEKPGQAAMEAAGPDALISMNCWRFDARIFEACRDVPPSDRGEYELPQAVGLAVERGVRFHTFDARGEVLDLSRRSDVAGVSSRLAGRAVAW